MTQPDIATVTPANQGGGGGGIPATLFTKDQVDHTAAQARRGALGDFFSKLGLKEVPSEDQLKGIFEAAAEHEKTKQGQKTDVERLTGELATANEKVASIPALEAAKRRAELAGDAGLKSRYHKYVEGTTDEEIQESIKIVLADVGGGGTGAGQGGEENPPGDGEQQQQQGTGATGGLTPNPQQGTPGAGSGQKKASMASGAEAYKARHGDKKE